jgi:hypothetical protein
MAGKWPLANSAAGPASPTQLAALPMRKMQSGWLPSNGSLKQEPSTLEA